METNSKPMYQPWNEEEFQADVFVRGMTWLQRHLYRALLQAAFFHGTRPYLPNDDEVLWVLSGAETQEMWEQNKARILKRFTTATHNANLLENKRVTADWERLMDARKKMSELGQRSAAVRQTLNGGSTPVQRPLSARPLTVNGGPTSEVEVEQEKKVEPSEKTVAGAVSESCNQSEVQPLGGTWKNIAVRHKRIFNKKASVSFQPKYAEACARYGEDIVLQFFDEWAPGIKSWVQEKGVDQPLNHFFKRLPEEATDAKEVADAIAEEDRTAAAAAVTAAEEKRRADEFQEASVERQIKEFVAFREERPVQNEESMSDFLAGLNGSTEAK